MRIELVSGSPLDNGRIVKVVFTHDLVVVRELGDIVMRHNIFGKVPFRIYMELERVGVEYRLCSENEQVQQRDMEIKRNSQRAAPSQPRQKKPRLTLASSTSDFSGECGLF